VKPKGKNFLVGSALNLPIPEAHRPVVRKDIPAFCCWEENPCSYHAKVLQKELGHCSDWKRAGALLRNNRPLLASYDSGLFDFFIAGTTPWGLRARLEPLFVYTKDDQLIELLDELWCAAGNAQIDLRLYRDAVPLSDEYPLGEKEISFFTASKPGKEDLRALHVVAGEYGNTPGRTFQHKQVYSARTGTLRRTATNVVKKNGGKSLFKSVKPNHDDYSEDSNA
jgi:hypothetical protein